MTERELRAVDPELQMFFQNWEEEGDVSQIMSHAKLQETQSAGKLVDTKTGARRGSRCKSAKKRTAKCKGKSNTRSRNKVWWIAGGTTRSDLERLGADI